MKKEAFFRCRVCDRKFSEEDIKTLSFFSEPDVMVCYDCFKEMQQGPFSRSCFGKLNVLSEDGSQIIHYGYDPIGSTDCSFYCPHRRVCKLYAEKRIDKLRTKLLTPFDGAVADLFRGALKGMSKEKFTKLSRKAVGGLTKLRKQLGWIMDEKYGVVKIYKIKKKVK